jgi:hypothetical protein
VGAVVRHLAESAFWVLTKNEPCRDPETVPPRQGWARAQHVPTQARELIVTPLLKVIMPLDGGTRSRVVDGIDVSGRRTRVRCEVGPARLWQATWWLAPRHLAGS